MHWSKRVNDMLRFVGGRLFKHTGSVLALLAEDHLLISAATINGLASFLSRLLQYPWILHRNESVTEIFSISVLVWHHAAWESLTLGHRLVYGGRICRQIRLTIVIGDAPLKIWLVEIYDLILRCSWFCIIVCICSLFVTRKWLFSNLLRPNLVSYFELVNHMLSICLKEFRLDAFHTNLFVTHRWLGSRSRSITLNQHLMLAVISRCYSKRWRCISFLLKLLYLILMQ